MNRDTLDFIGIIIILLIIFTLKLYNIPIINTAIILLLSFFAFRSIKPLFWFTFAFIYSNSPAGLFDVYTFGVKAGNVIIDFTYFLLIPLLIKSLSSKPSFSLMNKNYLFAIAILILINVVRGIISGFDDINVFFRIFKVIIPFLWIFIAFRIFKNENDFDYFFQLIFPFVFISLAGQIYIYFTGTPLATIIFDEETTLGTEIDPEVTLSRFVYSVFLHSIAFMGALFYLTGEEKKFNHYYLAVIVFSVLLSFYLSGTRAWVIGFITIFLLWILLVFRPITRVLLVVFSASILVIILLNFIPFFRVQADLAYQRIRTVELLAEGDITAGGTLQRFDVRAPRLMNYFWQTNPIFGAGYSQFMFNHQDGHVGHHNTLFQGGILGAGIMYLMFLLFIAKGIKLIRLKPDQWESAYLTFMVTLIGLLVIQTSVQIFGFTALPSHGLFYSILLTFGNYSYYMATQKKFDVSGIKKINFNS